VISPRWQRLRETPQSPRSVPSASTSCASILVGSLVHHPPKVTGSPL
jgi:hypothetical protein